MEPPFREVDQLTQHHSRARQNSGQLTYNLSGGSRGAKKPHFLTASLVHRVEAAVAHRVVNTARVAKCVAEGRLPLCWVFHLRGASHPNAEWTCGRAVQSMPSLQTALL